MYHLIERMKVVLFIKLLIDAIYHEEGVDECFEVFGVERLHGLADVFE